MTFSIPLHFEGLTRSNAGPWQVEPPTQRQSPTDDLLQLLDEHIHPVLSSTSAPSNHFQALYTLISRYQSLAPPHRASLYGLVLDLSRAAAPSNPNHLKIALFFSSGFASSAAAAEPACTLWEKTAREALLEAIDALVTSTPTPSSFSAADLDQLSSLLVRTFLNVLEHPSAAKSKHIRPILSRCLASALTLDERQALPANTALLHALCRHEHIPTPLANILHLLTSDHPNLQTFVSDFVCEISRLPEQRLVHEVSAAKSVAAFLADFVDLLPSVFSANLALLLSLLDVDSYTVRNGVVHVITTLIRENRNPDDPLLDVLLQRAHRDVNSFTRSKALQGWITLAEKKAIPHRLFPVLAQIASSRLQDRTATVRKCATQLLAALLNENPFGPVLRLSHFNAKLLEIQQQLPDETDHQNIDTNAPETESDKSIEEADNKSETSLSSEDGLEEDDEDEDEVEQKEEDSSSPQLDQEASSAEAGPEISEERQKLLVQKVFYKCAVDFIQAVEAGLTTIYNMLRSKSITDVSEAVSFVVNVVQFQLEASSGLAVRKMLPLLLARETNIRQKAIEAYVRLLAPGGLDSVDEKETAMAVAKGLTALVVGITMGELACMEELVHALSSSKKEHRVIVPAVVAVLWDIFAGRVPGASDEQRRGAVILVSMIASKQPDTVMQRKGVILQVGLNDPQFCRWSSLALTNLGSGSDPDGKICTRLRELCETSDDLSSVEQVINALYSISPEPEVPLASIINTLAKKLHSDKEAVRVPDLCRFFVVIGHVAVKQLVRIEHLVSQLRKRNANVERTEDENEAEEQAGAEAEHALELAEKELVSPHSLLGRYGNLARMVASDEEAPSDLRACAILCLAKLMCVQKKFCEKNLRLLFSILASNCEGAVRANAVTALGDLTFRFPNLVEPWSARIYGSLRDTDVKVRKNTLMVLTHLILNDMIKVKGQIVQMAVCILDKDERIADLARVFFHELSRKSANAIYNILPDTISCMSKMNDLASDQFKTVVALLISLMDKEKHADGMVEKLCHRFRSSESDRENRDLAYCISQLNISTKGVQKLGENFKSYSTAIVDEEVYNSMMQAIAKGNKGSGSGNSAQIVEELTGKIEAVRRTACEDDAQEKNKEVGGDNDELNGEEEEDSETEQEHLGSVDSDESSMSSVRAKNRNSRTSRVSEVALNEITNVQSRRRVAKR